MDTSEFFKHIKKDSALPDLSDEERVALWNRIVSGNRRYDRRYLRWSLIATGAAASICLALLLRQSLFAPPEQTAPETNYVAMLQSVPAAASQEVRLVLPDKQIAIEGKDSELDYSREGEVEIRSDKGDVTKAEKLQSAEVFNQLVVPFGRRSSITFADGTQMWVNSGSRVIYPANFGSAVREIFVEGEVMLDVRRDARRPFIVKTRGMDIRVMGTQFNVSAYDNEDVARVALLNGKVCVVFAEGKESVSLSPNQMFSYDGQALTGEVSSVNAEDFIAWRDGYFPFKMQALTDVLRKLSRYYNVRFTMGEGLSRLSCSGKLHLNDNLDDVLGILKKAAPIEVKKESDTTYIINVKP
ncbi:MAG: FecR domain-containing protein [Tannerellaceae bacterium]|jgi:hypothetical protein|nr:FecR domain-containing protein [Tannerellaceae bacterium]